MGRRLDWLLDPYRSPENYSDEWNKRLAAGAEMKRKDLHYDAYYPEVDSPAYDTWPPVYDSWPTEGGPGNVTDPDEGADGGGWSL